MCNVLCRLKHLWLLWQMTSFRLRSRKRDSVASLFFPTLHCKWVLGEAGIPNEIQFLSWHPGCVENACFRSKKGCDATEMLKRNNHKRILIMLFYCLTDTMMATYTSDGIIASILNTLESTVLSLLWYLFLAIIQPLLHTLQMSH